MATYRVNPDDNFLTLAKKFGTTVSALQKTNGIRGLTPGQTIRVPRTKAGPAGYVTTGPGETRVFTQGGNTVRVGPNSTLAPARPQTFFERLFGSNNTQDGVTGVRGAVPPSGGGKNARVAQMGTQWGQAGAGATPLNPYAAGYGSSANPNMNYAYPQPQRTTQPRQPYPLYDNPITRGQVNFGGGAPQYGDYGLPDTVRNTLTQNWNSPSLTLDMASRLYPQMTNQQIVQMLQQSGATFNMKNNSWDLPTGLQGGTSTTPNKTQDEQSALYQANRNERTGQSYLRGTARYGQQSFIRNGRVVNRDVRNIRTSAPQVQAAAATPFDPTGQTNSLVTWRV